MFLLDDGWFDVNWFGHPSFFFLENELNYIRKILAKTYNSMPIFFIRMEAFKLLHTPSFNL